MDEIGDIDGYCICEFIDDYHVKLGTYATKERALEILNEIMLRIHQLNMLELGIIRVFDDFTTIYEMPTN